MIYRIRDAMPLAVLVALLSLCVILSGGCAGKKFSDDPEISLYKSLKASAEAYNDAREGLRLWDKDHPFTPEQKERIEKYAADYRLAYHIAIEAWDLYAQGKKTWPEFKRLADDALDAVAKYESEAVKYE